MQLAGSPTPTRRISVPAATSATPLAGTSAKAVALDEIARLSWSRSASSIAGIDTEICTRRPGGWAETRNARSQYQPPKARCRFSSPSLSWPPARSVGASPSSRVAPLSTACTTAGSFASRLVTAARKRPGCDGGGGTTSATDAAPSYSSELLPQPAPPTFSHLSESRSAFEQSVPRVGNAISCPAGPDALLPRRSTPPAASTAALAHAPAPPSCAASSVAAGTRLRSAVGVEPTPSAHVRVTLMLPRASSR